MTEQYPRGLSKNRSSEGLLPKLRHIGLGSTAPELNVQDLGSLYLGTFDKTLFSMVIPQVEAILKERDFESVLILGIEVRLVCGAPLPQGRF